MQSWSIIIFGFNEEKTISRVISDANTVLQKISGAQYEIIVIDDGSTDQSKTTIEQYRNTIKQLHPIYHSNNRGIGAALISGYTAAKMENICAIPADGQFNIAQLLDYPEIEKNTVLSFYREKNDIYSRGRKILSWGNRLMLRFVFRVKIRDINWVKVYKRDALRRINIDLKSSLVESEICIKLLRAGNKLVEVPTNYLQREFGHPKGASFKIVRKAVAEIPALFVIVRRFVSAGQGK